MLVERRGRYNAWTIELRNALNKRILPSDYYAMAEAVAEQDAYLAKQRAVVVRHQSGDRVVALIEIVSPGNKVSRQELRAFINGSSEEFVGGFWLDSGATMRFLRHLPGK